MTPRWTLRLAAFCLCALLPAVAWPQGVGGGLIMLNVQGDGTVSNGRQDCVGAPGVTVTCVLAASVTDGVILSASPNSPTSVFTSWSGIPGCSTGETCRFHGFATNVTITAVFQAQSNGIIPQTGYWWNPAEGGRGFTIEQNSSSGNILFATYLYNANGSPNWYAAGPAPPAGTVFTQPLQSFSGGQTLTGAFHPATQGAPVANISITFSDSSHGMLTWPEGTIPLQRYEFTPGGLAASAPVTQPQAGYWWNPAEGGRGYTVEVQNNIALIAAYMYDGNGNAVWYAAGPAALTGNNTYQGSWTIYNGGQTLAGTYQAPAGTAVAGSVTIQFSSPTTATLTLPDGRQIPIQRYSF